GTGRHLPLRVQRGERGRRGRLPRLPPALPRDCGDGRGDAGSCRRRTSARPDRARRSRRRSAPAREEDDHAGMSVLIAILGLAFLVLIHEAGHFFTARAVGMKPRKFYIGFPPALAKTNRNGIEYGIGAIPLGGYVKIPGMHRPALADLDASFGPAMMHDPSLVGPVERLKRLIAEGNYGEARRDALGSLDVALEQAQLPRPAARAAKRGRNELADALGADAYWRQPTWKRV